MTFQEDLAVMSVNLLPSTQRLVGVKLEKMQAPTRKVGDSVRRPWQMLECAMRTALNDSPSAASSDISPVPLCLDMTLR